MVWCHLVCSEEGQDSDDTRAVRNVQTVNGTTDGLVGGFSFSVVWGCLGPGQGWNKWAAQAVWGHDGDPVADFESEAGSGVFGK